MKIQKFLRHFVLGLAFVGLAGARSAKAESDSIQGLYHAVLNHEQKSFYQYAMITLSTVNSGGGVLKISANVRIFFGDENSNEFLAYDFPEVPFNVLTSQISMKSADNTVSFIGHLGNGELSGEWYASSVGRVGTFEARKSAMPDVPNGLTLVRSVTGHYRGQLKNTNPSSRLPERVSLSLVSTQDMALGRPVLSISGNMRFYLGGYDSLEYIETAIKDVQFNFYSRYMTLKTVDHGITLKGVLGLDGKFQGEVFADGLGRVGDVALKAYP